MLVAVEENIFLNYTDWEQIIEKLKIRVHYLSKNFHIKLIWIYSFCLLINIKFPIF